MKFMNKRGVEITLNNVLSLIIAAIAIGLLAFGAAKLYQVYTGSEVENARNTLNIVMAKIEALEEGESNKFLIQGFEGAENWYLEGWSKNEEGRPDKCSLNSCLCVCKLSDTDACQNNGFCRKIDNDELKVRSVTGPSKFDKGAIDLQENVIEIEISKEDVLYINYFESGP
jgi:hypothetical protein